MVRDRLDDGIRIAELLASEVSGGATRTTLSVIDADDDVDPSVDGTLAYRVELANDDDEAVVLADVNVHPDRCHVAFRVAPEVATQAAADAELRVRPKATQPPQTLVFVEDGGEVKQILPVVSAVADHVVE
jgi:hypothetical protein